MKYPNFKNFYAKEKVEIIPNQNINNDYLWVIGL